MKQVVQRFLSGALTLAMLTGLVTTGGAASAAPDTQVTLSPVADTYINQDGADVNHGTEQTLTVRKGSGSNENRLLLKFDISGFSGAVDSAALRLKTTGASSATSIVREQYVRIVVSEVADAWTEAGATWNNTSMLSATPVTEQDIYANVGQISELDLTDYVRGAVEAGKTQLSLVLTSKQYYASFASRESGAGPVLSINPYGPEDESGHALWLRYHGDQAPRNLVAGYRAAVQSIVTDQNCSTPGPLKSAVEELKLGAKGLLGSNLTVTDAVGSDGAVVLGTGASTLISGLGLDLTKLGDEGYLIKSMTVNGHQAIVVAANGDSGVLYGVFRLLALMQTGKSLEALNITDKPANDYRMLNHWDNPNLSIERGYAGLSLWDWSTLPEEEAITDPIYREYARANASIGINGIVLNNVNAKPEMITQPYLKKIARLADLMGEYGIKLYISLNFGSPKSLDKKDFTWDELQPWWTEKFTEIHTAVPELGGFLIKADSEGQPGPNGYGKGHVDGANMLGDALKASDFGENGLIIWRAFVYGGSGDRATQAYNAFKPLDGQFHDNVVIQIKNGPLDFQTRETVHPLFGAMPDTNIALELQITQEYTGQDLHNCYLVPQWKEILDFDTYANGEGSTVAKLIGGEGISMMAGVANTAGLENWTGLQLAQANWYGFGRLAWDPTAAEADITKDWTAMTFGNDEGVVETVAAILSDSWRLYESYTSPLGLHFVTDGQHLKPNPSGREAYHKADKTGIGYPRSSMTDLEDMSIASNNFFPENRDLYADPATCPEELLLWFHHVGWTDMLKNGDRLIDRLYRSYAGGMDGVQRVIEQWQTLEGKIDDRRYHDILAAFQRQKEEAKLWRDTWVPYLEGKSGVPMDRPALPGRFSAAQYAPGGHTVEGQELVLQAGESVSYWGKIEWGTYLTTLHGSGEHARVEVSIGGVPAGTIAVNGATQAWSEGAQPARISAGADTVTLTVLEGTLSLTDLEFILLEGDPDSQNWALASRGAVATANDSAAPSTAGAAIDGLRAYTGIDADRWRTKQAPAWLEVELPRPINLEYVYLFNQQKDDSGYLPVDREQTTSLQAPPLKVSYWDPSAETWVPMGSVPESESHVWLGISAPAGVVTDKIRVDVEKVRSGWVRLIEVEAWGTETEEGTLHALTLEGDGAFVTVGDAPVSGRALTARSGDVVTAKAEGNPQAFEGWEVLSGPVGFALPQESLSDQTLTFPMPEGGVVLKANYRGENWALPSKGGKVTIVPAEGARVEGTPEALIDGIRYFNNKTETLQKLRRWRTDKVKAEIVVELAQPVALDTVNLFGQQKDNSGYYEPDRTETSNLSASALDVSYWNMEAGNWTLLGRFPETDQRVWLELFAGSDIVTDKIKIEPTSLKSGWVRLIEVEVWGTEEASPTVTGVEVSPAEAEVKQGETQRFQAEVVGEHDPSQRVTWTVEGGSEGTTMEDGLLTVAIDEAARSLTVKAISTVDDTKFGTATVTVVEAEKPGALPVITTEQLDDGVVGEAYRARLEAQGDQPISWSVNEGVLPGGLELKDGVISGTPTEEGSFTFTVKAKNSAGEDTQGLTIEIKQPQPEVTGVTISPETAQVQKGTSQQFTATVTGENEYNKEVLWSVEVGEPAEADQETEATTEPINEAAPEAEEQMEGSPEEKAANAGPDSEPVDDPVPVTAATEPAAGTSISGTGLLTVADDETAVTLIVTATAVGDSSRSGTAIVTVTSVEVERYALTVTGGEGTGEYEEGARITVTAHALEAGKQFKAWAAEGVTLEEATANPLIITMPANDVILTATYEAVDTGALDSALAAAEAAKAGIIVIDQPASAVDSGTKYVSTETMAALDAAIETAEAAKAAAESQASVDGAASALKEAIETFEGAIQTGTYVPSSGSSGSNTKTETVKNEDGSTTKTVTNKSTGTVTETTTWPNGDKMVVVTKKGGTRTETVTKKDGTKSETVTKPDGSVTSKVTTAEGVKSESEKTADGNVTATVTLPKDVEGPVVLPVEPVAVGKSEITVKGGEKTQVVIPVKEATASTVAVIVKADGTSEIVKTSVLTEEGVSLTVSDGMTVKLVDNGKDFGDMANHWATEAVSFVTSRELFNGTEEGAFAPDTTTSRAMLFTVLARLEGVETEGGASWYSKAMEWAQSKGISDGTNPEGTITREQLATMLYRYAGNPAAEGAAKEFVDSESVSDWASEAMDWAVKSGILTGKDGNRLDPTGTATRAEVATMLMRFVISQAK